MLVAPAAGPLVDAAQRLGAQTVVLEYPRALATIGDDNGSRASVFRWLPAIASIATYRRRLKRLIRAHQPSLIHSNALKTHILLSSLRLRVPIVWHMHDYPGPRSRMARLLRLVSSRCALVVANSNSVRDDTARVVGGRTRVRSVYNGVDLQRFTPAGARADLDALAGLPAASADTVRIGLIATFSRWKGHEIFLHAIAMLPREMKVRAYIVGGPIYRTKGSEITIERLRALTIELGLVDRVGFTGAIAQVEDAMRALDVVVHASTRPEPFGLVIAEAMACGRAVVLSHAGGALELVDIGRNALTHTPGDARSLADVLKRLISDDELRAGLGRAARDKASAAFGRERYVNGMRTAYESVLA